MSLHDRLSTFPGGLRGLARAAGVQRSLVYRLVCCQASEPPTLHLARIETAIARLAELPLELRGLTVGTMAELWQADKDAMARASWWKRALREG